MMPFHMGHVNCYLIKTDNDHILIDTGCSSKRAELKKELEKINWRLDYGSVKIQIRQGKPALLTIERTVRLD